MNEVLIQAMAAFLCGHPDDGRLLAVIRGPWKERIPAMVDDFYERILADPSARQVLRDPLAVDRLRVSLCEWAYDLLDNPAAEGPEAAQWFERRTRIGTRHVEVGLPPRFMPLAMNVVRVHIHQIICQHVEDRAALAATLNAADRALDLELAVMLESYRQLADSELRKTERLATVGRLATGISHELRNPLGIINTGVHILGQLIDRADAEQASAPAGVSGPARRQRDEWRLPLERIARGARQARELSNQLLEYVRVRTPRLFSSPVLAVLQEACAIASIDDSISIDVHVTPEDLCARCDAADLARCLSNLISNAGQAAGDDGSPPKVHLDARAVGRALEIRVTDNGPGVSSDLDGRIFEPLYTTRPNATGLGLAIARDLVSSQRGTVSLANPGERGACFLIRLDDAVGEPG